MARGYTCDVCKNTVERVEAKLFLAPVVLGGGKKSGHHAHYTHRADICGTCLPKLKRLLNFQERGTQEAYYARGRNGNSDALEEGDSAEVRTTGDENGKGAGRKTAAKQREKVVRKT